MKTPSSGYLDPDVMASHSFDWEGRSYLAELRFVGFPQNHGVGGNPRWVVFDDAAGRHWTLEGAGSPDNSADEVRARFLMHLRQLAAEPHGWRRWTSMRHRANQGGV
jgi:hypothetical protein